MKKRLALFLAVLVLLLSAVSCSKQDEPDQPDTAAQPAESGSAPEETADDRYKDVDYDGAEFRINTSVNEAAVGMAPSNVYIQGNEELTGDAAPDAVFKRNEAVSEGMNVTFSYEQVDTYLAEAARYVRILLLSGDTSFHLFINDIYGLVPLSTEGLFRNVDKLGIDFSSGWWYDDFMTDISLSPDYRFTLAGDYFIDQLRCTHCLLMNKELYNDLYGDPDDVYRTVLDREWTVDRLTELISGAYVDKNGNTFFDNGDQFGTVGPSVWGSLIPFLISGDPGFITRDEDGFPVLAVNNETSYKLLEKANALFGNKATYIHPKADELDCIEQFVSGKSLFIFYLRLATLESSVLRDAPADFAVLPYPLRDSTQKEYVTSTHDAAEMGFVPYTVSDDTLPFVGEVLDALCRETSEKLLPVYYESSLKIKYSRDSLSGQMIDIIHDHYGNGFALAWSNALSGILLETTFRRCVENGSTDFVSAYRASEKHAVRTLNNYVSKTLEKCESK